MMEGGFVHAAGGEKNSILSSLLNGWRIDTIPELYVASSKLKPGKPANAVILRAVVMLDGVSYERNPVQITATVPTRRDGILSRLVGNEDRVTGERWIRHIRAAKDRTTETQLSPTFQIINGKPTNLRVLMCVVEKNLAIPNAIEIRTGEKNTMFPVKYSEVNTEVGSTTSAAWVEGPVKAELLTALSSVAKLGRGAVHFEIRNGSPIDLELGREAAMRISDVLVGYKLRGGEIADEQLAWFREQVETGDKQLIMLTNGVKLQKYVEAPRMAVRSDVPTAK